MSQDLFLFPSLPTEINVMIYEFVAKALAQEKYSKVIKEMKKVFLDSNYEEEIYEVACFTEHEPAVWFGENEGRKSEKAHRATTGNKANSIMWAKDYPGKSYFYLVGHIAIENNKKIINDKYFNALLYLLLEIDSKSFIL